MEKNKDRRAHYHCTYEPNQVVFKNFSLHPSEFCVSDFIAFFPPLPLQEFEVRQAWNKQVNLVTTMDEVARSLVLGNSGRAATLRLYAFEKV